MTTSYTGVQAVFTVSGNDVASLRRHFSHFALRQAKERKLIRPGEGISQLAEKYFNSDPCPDFVTASSTEAEAYLDRLWGGSAKHQAIARLRTAAFRLLCLEAAFDPKAAAALSRIVGAGVESDVHPFIAGKGTAMADAWVAAKSAVARIEGFMDALQILGHETSKAGAAAQAKIGETSRDKVRQAAARYNNGTQSKAEAAVSIAKEVHKSIGHVQRLLSDLFPGDQWIPKASRID